MGEEYNEMILLKREQADLFGKIWLREITSPGGHIPSLHQGTRDLEVPYAYKRSHERNRFDHIFVGFVLWKKAHFFWVYQHTVVT